ncbi:MAG: CvpA family protein [Deltaproteobacteria bacterium]|nr:CvpA family protein [Deltaproteobacteria bacterium]MBW2070850.1 CvpA family protein [Deltaproteobacteria bacterium]
MQMPHFIANLNILDVLLFSLLAISVVRGFMLGMIRQVVSLLGILAAFFAAGRYYKVFAVAMAAHLPALPYGSYISYALLFVASWLLVVLLGSLLGRFTRAALMGWADRLLGTAMGLVKGVLVVVVVVTVLTLFLPARSRILTTSHLVPRIQYIGYYLVRLTPTEVRHLYQKRSTALYRYLSRQKLSKAFQ